MFQFCTGLLRFRNSMQEELDHFQGGPCWISQQLVTRGLSWQRGGGGGGDMWRLLQVTWKISCKIIMSKCEIYSLLRGLNPLSWSHFKAIVKLFNLCSDQQVCLEILNRKKEADVTSNHFHAFRALPHVLKNTNFNFAWNPGKVTGRGSCEKLNPANLRTHGMMQWGSEPEGLSSSLSTTNY